MLNGLQALISAQILPSITNLTMESNGKTVFNLIMQANAKFNKKTIPWFKDSNIVKLLKLKIFFSFSKNATEKLKNSNLITHSSDKDVLVLDEFMRLDGSAVLTKTKTDEFLSDTISRKISTEIIEPTHLTIFWMVYFDKQAIAEKFKISPSLISKDFFVFENELFIDNGKIVNNKLQRIDTFIKLSTQNLLIEDSSVHKTKNFVSLPLYTSKKNKGTFLFFIDLQELLKQKSVLKQLMNNTLFLKEYLSSNFNTKPRKIVITKKNDVYEEVLLNSSYSKITTPKCVIEEINLSSQKFGIIFTDLNINQSKVFEYKIRLIFNDNTIAYLDKLQIILEKNDGIIEQICNIASYGNYYISELKRFDSRFFELLQKRNFSLKSISDNFIYVAKRLFTNLPNGFNELSTMIDSKNITIELLDELMNLNHFLLSEISRLKNSLLSISSSTIDIEVKLFNEVDLSSEHIHVDMFSKDSIGIQNVTNVDFQTKINNEILRYYKNLNLTLDNKYRYFSADSISTDSLNVNIAKQRLHQINFNEYNKLFVDYLQEQVTFNDYLQQVVLSFFNNGIYFEHYSKNIAFDDSSQRINDQIIKENLSILSADEVQRIFPLLLSFVISNDLQFFDTLKENDENSILSDELLQRLPFQIKSICDSYSENEFVNLNIDAIKIIANKVIGFIFNFKMLFELQYLESINDTEIIWKPLTFLPKGTIICRWTPYINEDLKITENRHLRIKLNNQIFLITG